MVRRKYLSLQDSEENDYEENLNYCFTPIEPTKNASTLEVVRSDPIPTGCHFRMMSDETFIENLKVCAQEFTLSLETLFDSKSWVSRRYVAFERKRPKLILSV